MFNKKRIVIFLLFLILMFLLITFGNKPILEKHLVTFIDGFNDTTISEEWVELGKDAKVPENPKHTGYVFAGWFLKSDKTVEVKSFDNIKKDITVVALYEDDRNGNGIPDSKDLKYTVTFRDTISNEVLKTEKVLIGMDAKAPNAPKHKGYTFVGWSRDYTNVTANIIVDTAYIKTASSDKIPAKYTVTFVDGDTNEVIKTQEVLKGLSATAPTAPEHADRVFVKWDGEYTNVTSNRTVTAIYANDLNNNGIDDELDPKYKVEFKALENGTLEGATIYENVLVGLNFNKAGIIAPNPKPNTNYVFDKWSDEFSDDTVVSENLLYEASFVKDPNKKLNVDTSDVTDEAIVYDELDEEEIKNQVKVDDEYVDVNPKVEVEIPEDCTAKADTTCTVKVIVTDDLDNRVETEVEIEIKKRPVTVTIDDKTSVYQSDIQELTSNADEMAYKGNSIGVTLSTTATKDSNVGTYPITGEWSNKNYDVTFIDGVYTITKKHLDKEDIINDFDLEYNGDGEATYDGEEHKSVIDDSKLPDGIKVEGDREVGGTDADEYSGKVEVTCSGNYECDAFEIETSVTVNKKDIKVTTESKEKVYDGTALKAPGKVEGIIDGETYTFKTTGEQINVGTSDNTYELTFDKTAKESNYNISEEKLGKLTVTAKSITEEIDNPECDEKDECENPTITELTKGMSVSKLEDVTYNGKSQKQEPTVKDGDKVLAKNTDYELSYSNDTTNVGEVVVTIKGIGNYTGSYDVTYNITKAPLKVTTESANKIYDGTALTAPGKVEGLVNGEEVTFTVAGTQTDVGESKNIYAILFNKTAIQANYELTEVVGTLTVSNKTINDSTDEDEDGDTSELNPDITLEGLNDVVYNGQSQKLEPTLTDNKTLLAKGKDYTVSYSENTTDVGEVTVTITGIGNYSGTYTTTYEITKKPVTVTTPSDSKAYDGTALTKDGSVEGLVDTHTFKTTGTITNVGSIDNTYSLVFENESKRANYTITENIGTLTVTAKSIVTETPNPDCEDKTECENPTIKELTEGMSVSKLADVTYNGENQQQEPTVKDGETVLEKGTDYELTYSNDTKNVGTVTVTITAKGNYTGSYDVTYKINKKDITVTTLSDSKVYDGTALKAPGKVEGIVEGETYTFKTTGAQTNVGESDNTYELTFNGTAREENYNVVTGTIGKLTVTAKSITETVEDPDCEGESCEKIEVLAKDFTVIKPSDVTYNGLEQKQKPTVIDVNTTLVEGRDYTLSYSANTTHVGEVTVTITGIGNYKGSYSVTYNINKATITIVTGTDTKVYDKKPLTKEGSMTGLVNGETATFTVVGSQTEVGTSNNTYVLLFNGSAIEADYTIDETIGTLTVTRPTDKVVVTITGDKDTVIYDGEEHSISGYDISVSNINYSASDFTFNGTSSITRTDVGEYHMGLKASDFENKNDNFNEVEFIIDDGLLKINPRSLNTTDEDGNSEFTVSQLTNVVYNGSEQKQQVTITDTKLGTTLTKGVDYTVSYSANTTDVGVVTVTVNGIGNYTGTYELTYNITKRPVTVNTPSDSKVYDGTALTKDGSVEGLVDTHTFETTGTITNVGSTNNTYSLVFENESKRANYTITENIGTLTVTAKSIVTETPNPDCEDKTECENPTITELTSGMSVEGLEDVVYDGRRHVENPVVKDGNKILVENTDYRVTYSTTTEYINVGVINVTIEGIGNYSGVYTTSYNITPASVVVSANDNTKVYGESDPVLTAAVTGLVEGDSISYTVTRENGNNVGTYTITADGEATQGNYTVTYENAEFTITQVETEVVVTIIGNSDTKVYDGTEHTVSGYKVTINNSLYTGFTFSGTAQVKATNAGTHNMGLAEVQFANTNTNFKNVTFKVTDGTLTINRKDVKVTADNNSKTYGDNEPELTATVEGTLGDDSISYTLTREPGENADTYVIKATGDATQGNYNVTYVPGTFTINKLSGVTVTITGNTATYKYDGNEKSVTGYTVRINNNKFNETDIKYAGEASATRTNVGTTNMDLNASDFSTDNNNFENVVFTVATDGYVKITPVIDEVTVTIKGNTLVIDHRDGQEHTVSGYSVTNITNTLLSSNDISLKENAKASATRSETGKTFMGLTSESFVNNNANFTNVKFVVTDGYVQIDPAYTITWVDEDGTTVLEIDTDVLEGETPTFNGTIPTKARTDEYTYTFNGWTPSVTSVNENATYKATYKGTKNEYTVTWKNYDGTVLETDSNVEYGTMPEYNGNTPTKERTQQYTYTYAGWDKEVSAVTGNITYTATFDQTVNKYTVKFYALTSESTSATDLKLINTQEVEYGSAAKEPTVSDEIKISNKLYYFAAWQEDYANITENIDVHAKYSDAEIKETELYSLKDNEAMPTTMPYSAAYTPQNNWAPYEPVGSIKIRVKNYQELENDIQGLENNTNWCRNNSDKCATTGSGDKELIVAYTWSEVKKYLTDATIAELDKYNTNAYKYNWYVLKYCLSYHAFHLDGIKVYNGKEVQSITLNQKDNSILKVGNTMSVTATITPSDSRIKGVVWSTSDSSIATISGSGNTVTIRGIKAGKATITVKSLDGIHSASISVTVTN